MNAEAEPSAKARTAKRIYTGSKEWILNDGEGAA
jgi:hypothetical protein